jgi:hypothetical protein
LADMSMVIVSLEPSEPKMLLVGIRGEMLNRPWLPPGRHWPELPLVGGRDELAGGTWLAVHPAIPRVACVLNGRGQHAPQPFRKSRGELPLLTATGGRPALDGLDPAAYDPFHLIVGDIASVQVLSWDGVRESRISLGTGMHVITSNGMNPQDPKALRLAGKFTAVRPAVSPSAAPGEAWAGWHTLAGGGGTSSVSYVAFAPAGMRYDFEPVPGRISAVAVA